MRWGFFVIGAVSSSARNHALAAKRSSRPSPTLIRLDEPTHLAHHPLDVRLGGPETRDARPQDWSSVAEPDFRHPRDLLRIEGRQELGGDEAVPREAHQR